VFPNKFFKPDQIKKTASYMTDKGGVHGLAKSGR
jgi:hypothetical protein